MAKKPQARVLIIASDYTMARFIEKIYLKKLYAKYTKEDIEKYELRPKFNFCTGGRSECLIGLGGSEDRLVILEGNWWRSFDTPSIEEVRWRLDLMQRECPEMEIKYLRVRMEDEDVEVR
jgi:hypothetical protein